MDTSEVWQRGPLPSIPALLQPVAHALLQAKEEIVSMMINFPEKLIWEKPAGVACAAFHLQHLTGVLDRLFTYARKESLTTNQLHALEIEGDKMQTNYSMQQMIDLFCKQVNDSIDELSKVNVEELTTLRTVGRNKISSTLIGLYVHAAEHTMRHVGQLLVTVSVLKEKL